MCLILLAYRCHPRNELVIAANRDEFFARPTAAMDYWQESRELLAGRDLQAGGTWLGVTRRGRFAAITNYRSPQEFRAGGPSRGLLVSEFLTGELDARACLAKLSRHGQQYRGFSLLLADAGGLSYYSNRGTGGPTLLQPGVYGLSNHLLDTDWPKVKRGRQRLGRLLSKGDGPEPSPEQLLALMMDKSAPADEDLPDTGVGLELERRLGAIFIEGPGYGTRSSTALLLRADGGGLVVERTHPTGGGETASRRFEF